MNTSFMTSVSIIAADPVKSRDLYLKGLSLPLNKLDGEYYATEALGGCNQFGVWPLSQAAEACFGQSVWPADYPVPQVSIEFELESVAAVSAAVEELKVKGFAILHDAKTEPWGQVVARLQTVEGAILGLSYAPSLHE